MDMRRIIIVSCGRRVIESSVDEKSPDVNAVGRRSLAFV
jgi:hypothetical protein